MRWSGQYTTSDLISAQLNFGFFFNLSWKSKIRDPCKNHAHSTVPLSFFRIFHPVQFYQHKFQARELDRVGFRLFLKFPQPTFARKSLKKNIRSRLQRNNGQNLYRKLRIYS